MAQTMAHVTDKFNVVARNQKLLAPRHDFLQPVAARA